MPDVSARVSALRLATRVVQVGAHLSLVQQVDVSRALLEVEAERASLALQAEEAQQTAEQLLLSRDHWRVLAERFYKRAGELEAALRLVIEYDDAVLEWDAMPSREPGKREASDRANDACKAMIAAARALAPATPEKRPRDPGPVTGTEPEHVVNSGVEDWIEEAATPERLLRGDGKWLIPPEEPT